MTAQALTPAEATLLAGLARVEGWRLVDLDDDNRVIASLVDRGYASSGFDREHGICVSATPAGTARILNPEGL